MSLTTTKGTDLLLSLPPCYEICQGSNCVCAVGDLLLQLIIASTLRRGISIDMNDGSYIERFGLVSEVRKCNFPLALLSCSNYYHPLLH